MMSLVPQQIYNRIRIDDKGAFGMQKRKECNGLHLTTLVNFAVRNEYLKQKKMFLGSRARRVHRDDNLTAICEPIVWTMWDP
jgi:hypothetical protein